MNRRSISHGIAGLLSFTACALTTTAQATVTNVDLSSYYNDNWSPEINGSQIEAAPVAGDTGLFAARRVFNGRIQLPLPL